MEKLLNLVDSDSRKIESDVLAVGGCLPKPLNVTANSVKYGFKAPVAMTLGPYWAYLLKDFKMLHVLRDGRDISFSANQVVPLHFLSWSVNKKIAIVFVLIDALTIVVANISFISFVLHKLFNDFCNIIAIYFDTYRCAHLTPFTCFFSNYTGLCLN